MLRAQRATTVSKRVPLPDGGGSSRYNISDITALTIEQAITFFASLDLNAEQQKIAEPILREINARLGFLASVGLNYLTLDRTSATLSGGEAQRIRLATQVGSGLVGVCYVLDEPTIGLHQRDNDRLIGTLRHLTDIGNTVLVVEHDEGMIRAADHVVDIGPGAGKGGGTIVAQGSVKDILAAKHSRTGAYLSGRCFVPVPDARRDVSDSNAIVVKGARQNNLKSVDVAFPLGGFICVTGVSGSGKSTLVNEILLKAAKREVLGSRVAPGDHSRINGLSKIERVVEVDQSPIGRTPRSNPATYTGIFDDIRNLFTQTREAKIRGYEPGRFSFNVKGGRCEACQGQGVKKIEMHFLPDVFVTCETCKGKRYNRETLEITYRHKTISDVLDMTVEEAVGFFEAHPRALRMLQCLHDVGLDYVQLGQPSTTLSGGEAQRIKLAAELGNTVGNNTSPHTLYVLDEPTTGLHFADVHRLIGVLNRLADAGHTLVVIEHNLDVIKSADWVIDLGPEGGDRGGTIVATGTPEHITRVKTSYTGQYLKPVLTEARPREKSRKSAATTVTARRILTP
jgi:excinuclease ABC subunit A